MSTQASSKTSDGQRHYHAKAAYQLVFSVSKDELECRAMLEVKPNGQPPGLEELQTYLETDGINTGVDTDALAELLKEAVPGKSVSKVVASGIPPVTGENGSFAFSVKPADIGQGKSDSKEAGDSDKIDFRSVQQFINVEPDQEIGRILPPGAGTPGTTIRGIPIKPEAGKPLQLKLEKGVRTDTDDDSILISESHGRVKLDGDSIQVLDEYVVDGDVDFAVGNIRFNGFVEVRGDVLDGFQVSASKGMMITGNVGACNLVSHGDIAFCGMNGQGKGTILCGGNITANFIHDSKVECRGDLMIAVELRNCQASCQGRFYSGLLSGGRYIALKGIEAKRVGSLSAVKTRIQSGVSYHDVNRLEQLLEQLEQLVSRIEASRNDLEQLKSLAIEKQKLMAAIIEVRKRRPEGSNPKVNVKDRIFEGVSIQLGGAIEVFKHEENGPFSLIENSSAGGLRRLPLSSLEQSARDLESACLQQEEQERLEREAAGLEEESGTDFEIDFEADDQSLTEKD